MKLLIYFQAFLFLIACSFFFSTDNCFAQHLIQTTVKLDSAETAKIRSSFKTEKEIRKNWSKLRKGMTSDEVVKLLGYPKSEWFTTDLSIECWKYNRGEIIFNNVSHTVSGWEK